MGDTKKYYKEIHLARGIGVLVVLLGHSFPDAEWGIFPHPFFQWIYDLCYAFHMPLFFVISGFVMARRFFDERCDFRRELTRKFKRLMIPYLFLSYLSLLPKILWNSYARNPVDVYSVWRVLLGKSPNGSLWYLYTLFIFSLMALCLWKLLGAGNEWGKQVCLIGIGVLFYISDLLLGEELLELVFLNRICRYFLFYGLGMLAYRHYEKLKKLFCLCPGCLAFILLVILVRPYLSPEYLYLPGALLGIYAILSIAFVLCQKDRDSSGRTTRFLEKCADYSYDIYIISYYIQQGLRVLLYRQIGMPYVIVLIIEFLGGFLGAVLISKYVVRKNAFLRTVIIGGEGAGQYNNGSIKKV